MSRRMPTVRNRLRRLVVVLVLLQLGVAWISALALLRAQEEVDDLTLVTGPAVEANTQVLQDVLATEVTLHSAAGGAEGLTEPLPASGIRARLEDLDRLVGGRSAGLDAGLEEQQAAVAAWERHVADTADRLRAGRSPDLQRGADLVGQVRERNEAVGATLRDDRQQAQDNSRQALPRALGVLSLSTAVAVVIALTVGYLAATSLTRPIARLQQVVRRQRAGDPSARADERDGAAEIRALAADVNALSEHNTALLSTEQQSRELREMVLLLTARLRTCRGIEEARRATERHLADALGAQRVVVAPVDDPRVLELEPLVESGAALCTRIGVTGDVYGVVVVVPPSGHEVTSSMTTAAEEASSGADRYAADARMVEQQATYVRQLEELDRQKSDFMATVSHELRTPLTSITGYLELLQDGDFGELTAEQQQALGVIERNSARLRGLIEDLLILNRIESSGLGPEARPVNLSHLALHVLETLLPVAQAKGVELVAVPTEHYLVVEGDAAQLDRAILNVVSNAVKFTPRGGTVTLEGTVVDGWARVSCQDTGLGIPAADQQRLFTRFFRASNATAATIPGTGLGLAIVKAIIEGHGGHIELRSVEGEGTTVVVDLPLHPGVED